MDDPCPGRYSSSCASCSTTDARYNRRNRQECCGRAHARSQSGPSGRCCIIKMAWGGLNDFARRTDPPGIEPGSLGSKPKRMSSTL